MNEKDDYQSAIIALKAKRQAIDIAIAELESLSGNPVTDLPSGTNSSIGVAANVQTNDTQIRSDEFWGMSITEAAKKYLDMLKRPRDTNAIADALKRGGNLSTSENFVAIVHKSLKRDKDFQRVKNEWGLTKWYVGRSLPVEQTTRPKKKSSKPKKKKQTTSVKKDPAPPVQV